jgi:hypothetical protein
MQPVYISAGSDGDHILQNGFIMEEKMSNCSGEILCKFSWVPSGAQRAHGAGGERWMMVVKGFYVAGQRSISVMCPSSSRPRLQVPYPASSEVEPGGTMHSGD